MWETIIFDETAQFGKLALFAEIISVIQSRSNKNIFEEKKYLPLPGIEPGPPHSKAKILPPSHGILDVWAQIFN